MSDDTIIERDEAEEAISHAYFLIIGHSPEWSNKFGYAEALQEIDDAQSSLRKALAIAEGALDATSPVSPTLNMLAAGVMAAIDTGLDGPDGVGHSDIKRIYAAMVAARPPRRSGDSAT